MVDVVDSYSEMSDSNSRRDRLRADYQRYLRAGRSQFAQARHERSGAFDRIRRGGPVAGAPFRTRL
jgi:hypothetical protein